MLAVVINESVREAEMLAVGSGVLAVVRSHPEWERPYTGIVSLQSGEIAEDLAKYLAESEQQNSAIALGVSINRDASIRAAGGYLIQVPHPPSPTPSLPRPAPLLPPWVHSPMRNTLRNRIRVFAFGTPGQSSRELLSF
jgi:hypothetical protein